MGGRDELRKGRKKGEKARSRREMRRWMAGEGEKKEGERRGHGGRGWEAVERNARRSRLRLIGKKIALARRR